MRAARVAPSAVRARAPASALEPPGPARSAHAAGRSHKIFKSYLAAEAREREYVTWQLVPYLLF